MRKFFNENIQIGKWSMFFNRYGNKRDIILDFGCGAGWGIFVGRRMGYEVYGLDVECPETAPFFKFRKKIDVDKYVKMYDGVSVPYDDNTFTLITCKSSLSKYVNLSKEKITLEKKVNKRVSEISRILKPKGIIITDEMKSKAAQGMKKVGLNIIQDMFYGFSYYEGRIK